MGTNHEVELARGIAREISGSEKSIRALPGGTRSSAFLLGKGHVLRISKMVDAGARFLNERLALAALDSACIGIRAPKFVAFGQENGCCWQVTTRVAGRTLSSAWSSMTDVQQHLAAGTAAEWLSILHSIQLSKFGEFCGPQFESNKDALMFKLENARAASLRNGRFSTVEFDDAAELLLKLDSQLDPVTGAGFRHGDFHFDNILWSHPEIGLVDFEWSCGGRVTDDFGITDYQDAIAPGSARLLGESYRAISQIPRDTFDAALMVARFSWKLWQSATRESQEKAAVNKQELAALTARFKGSAGL